MKTKLDLLFTAKCLDGKTVNINVQPDDILTIDDLRKLVCKHINHKNELDKVNHDELILVFAGKKVTSATCDNNAKRFIKQCHDEGPCFVMFAKKETHATIFDTVNAKNESASKSDSMLR